MVDLISQKTCGPNITDKLVGLFKQVERDFHTWGSFRQLHACWTAFMPVGFYNEPRPKNKESYKRDVHNTYNWPVVVNNSVWDIPALQTDSSASLQDSRVVECGCGSLPASPNNPEDPGTCSLTVQVGQDCWLAGTVNYGLYGIMARLCQEAFPHHFSALGLAAPIERYPDWYNCGRVLIGSWKVWNKLKQRKWNNGDDVGPPILWYNATFRKGPTGRPPDGSGNRANCSCGGCPLDGSIVPWDYVWYPMKPHFGPTGVKTPTINDAELNFWYQPIQQLRKIHSTPVPDSVPTKPGQATV